jgi:outer membrane lipoprotein-sorting protein
MAICPYRSGTGFHRSYLHRLLLLCLVTSTFPLGGCLFRTRPLERQFSNAPLKTASQKDLIEYVNAQAARIQSLQATVDIDASAADPKNGTVTDYKEIRGYILVRKPDMFRMKGLMPVVRNTAFDMVSDGKEFKLWVPPRSKFIIGPATGDNYQPEKRMENMRPQYFYEALLLPEIGPECPAPSCEIAVLENGYETVLDSKKHRVEQPDYELAVVRQGPQGWYLWRQIQFSRTDLLPHKQRIYDMEGNVATDVTYANYKDFGGFSFPSTIEIERPRENYDITLNILKLDENKALTNEQFALEQPPGAEVVHLGPKPGLGNSAAKSGGPGK